MTTETERLHPDAAGLDARPSADILALLLDAQKAALAAVAPALPAIERGAALMAETVRGGGRLVYAGAGSSALMANADALELPATFGLDPDRILLRMAGGLPTEARMPGATEDDTDTARRAGEALGPGDLVIAVAASGSTPYPVTLARAARGRGAKVVAVANNPGAPLFEGADVAVCLPTPPEMIAGSTRMGAGTAQKAALNLMSTLMGIQLGQVHDGMMVGVIADNIKLRARAAAIVARIAGVEQDRAAAALTETGGAVKPAVLAALGASRDRAAGLLAESQGNLRAALARMKDKEPSNQGRT